MKLTTIYRLFALVSLANSTHAIAKDYGPGVTDSSVKVGQTMPYSGPASAFSAFGKAMVAYFNKINAEGGVNGRKIDLLSLDDAYSPSKAVEQVRRLVESDEVFAFVAIFGTPSNLAVQKYLNTRKIPALFLVTGVDRVADPEKYPWSMGWQPNNVAKGKIYAKYVLSERPNAKIAILFQNDDAGRDYVKGFRLGLGDKAGAMILKELTYETSDPTIDSQVQTLKATGSDVFLDISSPKFTAQAIRRAAESRWDLLHLISDASGSIASVLTPAGLENSKGVVTLSINKDPSDPAWSEDEGMKRYLEFMRRYMPEGNPAEAYNIVGYETAQTFVHVLRNCGDTLTRENLMKEAANIKDLRLETMLPGIVLNTSPTRFTPVSQAQVVKFDGVKWTAVGGIIDAEKE